MDGVSLVFYFGNFWNFLEFLEIFGYFWNFFNRWLLNGLD